MLAILPRAYSGAGWRRHERGLWKSNALSDTREMHSKELPDAAWHKTNSRVPLHSASLPLVARL
jgi:hypothetical protein